MLLKALKGKIHRARVTQTKLEYPGSLGVDADMLKAAGIRPYEEVLLANMPEIVVCDKNNNIKSL
jgi:aspartate 1-decarboxylase